MFGSGALCQEDWGACTRLDKAPWDFSPDTLRRFAPGVYDPETQDVWELYDLPDDFSQAHNLVAEHPQKLAELKQLWWQEAKRNRVLPPLPTSTRFAFAGDVTNVLPGMVPRAGSWRMPTSSAASPSGSTARDCCITPTPSWAWRPTGRPPAPRSPGAS